ncbi:Hypothetical predicted protein [Xyrichtys novacula]|uniref:Uncharacterized protein n=1 Tax=Xyrichtys novacula TaxID=13765 RepID=A0AAV1HJ26_XYRNO|nr:Hypothetical predicted protein [Xyrichtys novacula]
MDVSNLQADIGDGPREITSTTDRRVAAGELNLKPGHLKRRGVHRIDIDTGEYNFTDGINNTQSLATSPKSSGVVKQGKNQKSHAKVSATTRARQRTDSPAQGKQFAYRRHGCATEEGDNGWD